MTGAVAWNRGQRAGSAGLVMTVVSFRSAKAASTDGAAPEPVADEIVRAVVLRLGPRRRSFKWRMRTNQSLK